MAKSRFLYRLYPAMLCEFFKNFNLLSKFSTTSMQTKKNLHKNDMSYQNMRIFKKLLFFSQKINFSMKNAIFLNFFNRTICYTQEKSCSSRFEPCFRPIMFYKKPFLEKVMVKTSQNGRFLIQVPCFGHNFDQDTFFSKKFFLFFPSDLIHFCKILVTGGLVCVKKIV